MKLILLIFGMLTIQLSIAQVPIGRDLEKGKTEFIDFMKNNGFTFFKESKEHNFKYNKETGKHDIPTEEHYKILFKEEVEVTIYFNQYENIDEIYIFPENKENKDKILKILKFDTWEFLYDRKYKYLPGSGKIYKVADFFAYIPGTSTLQINFFKDRPAKESQF